MPVASLYRYPVKGLSPERLDEAKLEPCSFFPGDRLYALENGRSSFDPAAPAYQPKTRFLMLMKNARLARVTSRFDDARHVLSLSQGGEPIAEGDVRTAEGRARIERCLADICAGELRGEVRLLSAPDGFRFTDSIRAGFVSLLNLASVRDLETRLGQKVDPLRFRANIHIEGWDAWAEEKVVGRILSIGQARVKALKTIERCPATHVDPETGERDLDIVEALRSAFGRQTCGLYVSVLEGGSVRPGDAVDFADLI
ncbi:MAG: MOSC domain-containing protein [Beijerinckiaceae bacterium]|nr:MOSC domain-containing protein [Beijerinckiaceae bacterium]MBX9759034.1 MOSC domain-containing protein [Beijerinckiaceae bacterium]